ncbi:MAG: type II secretion system protein [Planctomycetes bacterium]|nr:type II secretion system protein [Planctomycetota bacterium]
MSANRGFTIIELMVVISIIIALAGLILPTVTYFRKVAEIAATKDLVMGVASAVSYYQQREVLVPALAVPGLPPQQIRRYWDFNLESPQQPKYDYILDGDPDLDPGFSVSDRGAARNVSYRGFLGMTGHAVPRRHVDAFSRLVDSWKRPLHIRFAMRTYGSAWYGIWSDGPDGREGTPDDIKSWSDE